LTTLQTRSDLCIPRNEMRASFPMSTFTYHWGMKDRPCFPILQYMYLKGLCRPHCKQDPIYVFPVMKLRGLVPNFHIQISLRDEGQAVLSHPTMHVFNGFMQTTLQTRSDSCIPRNETARPRSQFLHSLIVEGWRTGRPYSSYSTCI
jgi:hypothetical protein